MESSAIGIIGGADGPTAVYLTIGGMTLTQLAVIIITVAFAVGFVAGYLYKRHKNKQ